MIPGRFRSVFLALLLPAGPVIGAAIEPGDSGASCPAIDPVASIAERKLRPSARLVDVDTEPTDRAAEAAAFERMKRVPPGETDVPVEKILAAAERAKQMPRISTALGRILPSEADEASLAAKRGRKPNLYLGSWTPLGPTNIGGRIRSLVIDPGDHSILYAGAVAGGVWKSTDASASWKPLDDGLANFAIRSLALDPNGNTPTNRVLYAGTGEYFPGSSTGTAGTAGAEGGGLRGAGIFKSTDSGSSWALLSSTCGFVPGPSGINCSTPDFYYVNKILVSPFDSYRIYAATWTGVWKSISAGATWTRVFQPKNPPGGVPALPGGVTDLVFGPPAGGNDTLVAACGVGTQSAVYRSTDSGSTWGPGGTPTPVLTETYTDRISLAVAPSNPSILYALAASSYPGWKEATEGVFWSLDGGATWAARTHRNPVYYDHDMMQLSDHTGDPTYGSPCGTQQNIRSQGNYDNVIAVDPVDPLRVWTGGIDLMVSSDGGLTWGWASEWEYPPPDPRYVHADHHAIAFDPAFDGSLNTCLFVANDGGVFRTCTGRAVASPDACINGANFSWSFAGQGLAISQFYRGVVYPAGGAYVGGMQDNGTAYGSDPDGPAGWRRLLGGDGGPVALVPGSPTVLWSGNPGLSIYQSTDDGYSWASGNAGITEPKEDFIWIIPLANQSGDPKRLFTGGRNMWRKYDSGNWQLASSALGLAADGSVTAIGLSTVDQGLVLAGMVSGKVAWYGSAQSSTGFTDWNHSTVRFGAFISAVVIDPVNTAKAWAVTTTMNGNHVFKGSFSGGTWNWTPSDGTAPGNLGDVPVHTIVVDPAYPTHIYIGTDIGVFASIDDGQSWSVEATGFGKFPVAQLVVEGRQMYAFTHGRGVFKVDLPPVGCGSPVAPVVTAADLDPLADTGVDVSWSAPSNWGDSGFNSGVRAAVVFKEGVQIALLTDGETSWLDESGENNVPYSYQVVFVNGCFNTTASAPVSARDRAVGLLSQYHADVLAAGLSDGAPVPIWADITSANHAVQGTASRRPTLVKNGFGPQHRSAVRFDGVDDQLVLNRSISTDFSIAVVFRSPVGNGGGNGWYDGRGLVDAEVVGVTRDFGMSFTGRIFAGTGGPDTSVVSSPAYHDGGVHVALMTRDMSTGLVALYVDGTEVDQKFGGTSRLDVPTRITIGSLQTDIGYFSGDIAEIRIYEGALSGTDLTDLETILMTYYGIHRQSRAEDSFILSNNPNADWTFGATSSRGSNDFAAFDQTSPHSGAFYWIPGPSNPYFNHDFGIARNFGDFTFNIGGQLYPADMLDGNPGNNGQNVVARWTAPSPGARAVRGRFQGCDTNLSPTTDVAVLKNRVAVWTGYVDGLEPVNGVDLDLDVAAGDTIDFTVGYGNGNYGWDSTCLEAGIFDPVPATACATLPTGAVAFWRGNDATDSVGSHDGTLVNGAHVWRGKVGNAFELDGGDDFVTVPDAPDLRPASLTLTAWFQLRSKPGPATVLIAKPSSTYFDSYGIWLEGGRLYAGVAGGGAFGTVSIPWSPMIGIWYHVAFTFDDSSGALVLYLDGLPVASAVTPVRPEYTSLPLRIGDDIQDGNDAFFASARIDEVALFGRVLTAGEIRSVWEAGSSGWCAPPPINAPVEAGASAPFRLSKDTGTTLAATYGPASCATDHAVYWGTTDDVMTGTGWSGQLCGLGTAGTSFFNLGPIAGGLVYFVIVGNNGTYEGSYGRNSAGVERPESTGLGACDYPRRSPNSSFKDCDGNPGNGCEVNTGTDTVHCGACNIICPAGYICANGTCIP